MRAPLPVSFFAFVIFGFFFGIRFGLDKYSSSSSSSADSSEASSGKLSYAEHKEQQKKIRKAEKAVKECETKIEKLETRKAEIDALLMKPENATNMELVTEYTELMKSLDEENENWMMLSEELEEIKNS